MTRQWTLRDERDTCALAQQLARLPGLDPLFVSLRGDLGSGKTTLVRHWLQALGVCGRIKSPTYAVLEPHQAGALAIWHFDFYRFSDPQEWEDAGFRDIFAGPGLKLAEWPEKAAALLPAADLALHLQLQANDARLLTLAACSPLGHMLARELPA